MQDRDRQALTLLAARIRERFVGARIWAFGSRTCDAASPESDLDVCIVLDDLNEDIDRILMGIAWEVGFDHGVVISTVTYSTEEFERGPLSESPLVRTVRSQGIAA